MVHLARFLEMSGSGPSAWVQERRLRTVYELLDTANYRKVITEVDRLLKKQPNFSCAKVLKALAFIRLNKIDDARSILAPVAAENPTDDGTIQALSICYRELEEPDSLCGILEAACEKEKSEELLTHYFMGLVRMREYKKMHMVALQLYKLYNKPTYYGWVVASLVIKFEFLNGPLEESDNLTLVLADRMMEKFMTEQKTPLEDNMLDLYLRVLIRLAKWQRIVDVLAGAGYPSSKWRYDEFHITYSLAMERTEKFDELFEYLKSVYLKNKDEYVLLKQIIDIFGERHYSMVQTFLDQLMEESPSRTVVLADLYFSVNCMKGKNLERIGRDLKTAVQYSVDKPSFYSDIMGYFKMVNRQVQHDVVNSVAPEPNKEGSNYDTIPKIIRDVNFEIISKEYIGENDNELNRLRQSNICFGKYLICDDLIESLRSGSDDNLRTKESDYHDQFVVIAAISLLSEYYKSPNLQKDCNLENYLSSKPWATIDEGAAPELFGLKTRLCEEQNKKKNQIDGLAEDLKDVQLEADKCDAHFSDKETLIILAICLLEYGLARSQYNYSMRILLSKAYARLGAVGQATKVIHGLDLKHVQWDSLGYLILPQALTSGTYTEAMKMLVAAETMYSSYKRESMEHVIAAYKYGSFSKIPEFIHFRTQLLESTQCGTVFVEKRLLELMTFSGSSQDLIKFAQNVRLTVLADMMSGREYTDNRDFSVLQFFDEVLDLDHIREITADRDCYLLKSRMMLLAILVELILKQKGADSTHFQYLDELIDKYEKHNSTWSSLYQTKSDGGIVSCPQFHAIWPHRGSRYFQILTPQYLADQIKVVQEIILQKDKPLLSLLQTKIEQNSDAMLKILRQHHVSLKEDKRISNIENYLEDFHFVLEAFSYTRILLDVAVAVSKFNFDSWKSKGKQKDKANQYQSFKKTLTSTVQAVLEKFKELHECFLVFIDTLKERSLPTLERMKPSMKDLLDESFLSAAFPFTFNTAQQNIRESQLTQLLEMKKIAASLIEYIRINLDSR